MSEQVCAIAGDASEGDKCAKRGEKKAKEALLSKLSEVTRERKAASETTRTRNSRAAATKVTISHACFTKHPRSRIAHCDRGCLEKEDTDIKAQEQAPERAASQSE